MRPEIWSLLIASFLVCAFFPFTGTASAAEQSLHPTNLRCEYLVDPLGIDQTSPRLSWMLESSHRGDRQTAYQVVVASSPELLTKDQGDLWDSGKVNSDESAHVVYAGKPLDSRQACYWKVRVWSPLNGAASAWSENAKWTIGLLHPTDWQAKWIDSTAAAAAEQSKQKVKIVHAVYTVVKRPVTTQPITPIDVTAMLSELAEKGSIHLDVTNITMGGEPALNVHKQLTVEYEYAGQPHTVTVAENKTLVLPDIPGRVWDLRKSFPAKGEIKSATLYVTALGLYEMHLNGQRVGDHILAPDWTDYHKRVRYQAYDVTTMLKTGNNAVTGTIANGWYAGHLGNGGLHQYGTIPALLAQLEITYADGSVDRIATDETWKTHPSAIQSTDFMLGEDYDAREELTDWDQPGLDDSSWATASPREEAAVPLESQVSPPVRETGMVKPVNIAEPVPGKWTYDMGQNMVGVVRLKVTAPAGTKITLHHAEMLNPNGTVYTTNLRGAPSVDTFICKGGGVETWQPKFTFHGFRYVELTGLAEKPALDAVTGIVLGSDTPRTGSFTCSDSRINQLMSNIQWGQRGNYLSVPTDCPQRDERLGWMGDAQVFVRTATCNADVAAFFTKWLVDVDDAQHANGAFTDVSPERAAGNGTPAWGDAGVICPWTIYLAYGDKKLLEQNLPAMTRWIEWCKTNSTDLIRDKRRERGGDYGDWLSIKADTPKDVIGTAYFAYSTHLVAKSYRAIGNIEQADKYEKLFDDIKAAFNKKYVQDDGRITGDTQCCYAMALKFELLPDKLRPAAAKHLVDDIKAKQNHLSTGFVGVSYLLPVLTQYGYADVAYDLLMQDTFPSWLFSVKHGATTIWERWDGWTPDKGFQDPSMNSFNHYSLGSCGEWLYDSVAGIMWDPEQPGYKRIVLRPTPGGNLTSAQGTLGSPYGKLSSSWKLNDGKFSLDVTIPANTTATLRLPDIKGKITESGKPIDQAEGVKLTATGDVSGQDWYELQSGTYSFEIAPQ
jgi:alpha-L-rhamnosidase